MKYLKTYESKKVKKEKDGPSVGDYVVCLVDSNEDRVFKDFMANNIGRMKSFYDATKTDYQYVIKFKNPESITQYLSTDDRDCVNIARKEIKFWSKDKDDCEAYLSATKSTL